MREGKDKENDNLSCLFTNNIYPVSIVRSASKGSSKAENAVVKDDRENSPPQPPFPRWQARNQMCVSEIQYQGQIQVRHDSKSTYVQFQGQVTN